MKRSIWLVALIVIISCWLRNAQATVCVVRSISNDAAMASERGDNIAYLEILKDEYYKGSVDAGYYIAEVYKSGDIVPKSILTSYYFFRESSLRGSAASQRELANFFLNGIVVKPNKIYAFVWFMASAMNSGGRDCLDRTAELINQEFSNEERVAVNILFEKCYGSRFFRYRECPVDKFE